MYNNVRAEEFFKRKMRHPPFPSIATLKKDSLCIHVALLEWEIIACLRDYSVSEWMKIPLNSQSEIFRLNNDWKNLRISLKFVEISFKAVLKFKDPNRNLFVLLSYIRGVIKKKKKYALFEIFSKCSYSQKSSQSSR